MNLALTTASVIVLLNAARKIRDIGMESLRAKVETGEQTETPSLAANQASVDRKILDELPIADKGTPSHRSGKTRWSEQPDSVRRFNFDTGAVLFT
jgi:hypothetical protein